jgi:hypothetical protein
MDLRFGSVIRMRGAGSRSPTHATLGVPCLACTGESNCPPLSKNNLIIRQCKWSRRQGTPPTASRSGEYGYGRGYCWRAASVARLWRCLLSFAAENAAPCMAIRNRAGLQTAIGNSTGVFACLPYDERAGKEGLIKCWMDRSGCDRTEPLRLATEERRRDNR